MIKVDINETLIRDVLEKVCKKTLEMDEYWGWPCGVAFNGIADACEVLNDEELTNAFRRRLDEIIDLSLPEAWNVNACAMGHSLLYFWQKTGEEKYKNCLDLVVSYIKNDALRFGDNVLQHTVSASNDFPGQAWADTLFMAAFVILKTGVYLDDRELIEDALNQYFWHIQYLQDENKQLWYHGYDNGAKNHMSGFFWARANAWAAYTMSCVGRVLPAPYLYPQYMEIDCALRDQLAALKLLQTQNGLWHTVLDDELSYEEVSASAGIAAAMVINGNPLHSQYIEKATRGILANISPEGQVLNVSAGTAVMRDLTGYRNVPKKRAQGWGQGLVLTFLTALFKAGAKRE